MEDDKGVVAVSGDSSDDDVRDIAGADDTASIDTGGGSSLLRTALGWREGLFPRAVGGGTAAPGGGGDFACSGGEEWRGAGGFGAPPAAW